MLRNELSREPEIEENDNVTVGLDWGTLSSSLLGLADLPNLILGRFRGILMLSVMCSYLIIGLDTLFSFKTSEYKSSLLLKSLQQ